jgi:predicted Zn-dependent peptidase
MYYEGKSRAKNKEIVETGKYEQDVFVMTYNMVNFTDRERKYVLPLFNNIFGGNELTSKLYRYLREENSLCYNVSSLISRYTNLFLIRAGIDGSNKDFCVELVNKALKEMKTGKFSEEDLTNAKKIRINELILADNTNTGYISREILKEFDGFTTVKDEIDNYKSVTKKEIMKIVDKLILNTIYLLKGEE